MTNVSISDIYSLCVPGEKGTECLLYNVLDLSHPDSSLRYFYLTNLED